jgi:hypothetical protein
MDSPNYAKIDYQYRDHYQRYLVFVEAMPKPLTCQDCGGRGGYKEIILDDSTGPWYDCGWCLGTGLVTPYNRGLWLKYKRKEKRNNPKQ